MERRRRREIRFEEGVLWFKLVLTTHMEILRRGFPKLVRPQCLLLGDGEEKGWPAEVSVGGALMMEMNGDLTKWFDPTGIDSSPHGSLCYTRRLKSAFLQSTELFYSMRLPGDDVLKRYSRERIEEK